MYYRCMYIYSHVTYVYECVSMYRDSGICLVAQRLGLCTSTAGSTSLIPGWGTKILPCSSAKKKKFFFLKRERDSREFYKSLARSCTPFPYRPKKAEQVILQWVQSGRKYCELLSPIDLKILPSGHMLYSDANKSCTRSQLANGKMEKLCV